MPFTTPVRPRLTCALSLAVVLAACSPGGAEDPTEQGGPTLSEEPEPQQPGTGESDSHESDTQDSGTGETDTDATDTGDPVALGIPDTLDGEVARVTRENIDGVPSSTSITVAEVDPDKEYHLLVACTSEPGEQGRMTVAVRDADPGLDTDADTDADDDRFMSVEVGCDGIEERHSAWVENTRGDLVQVLFVAPTDGVATGYAIAVPAD